MALFPGIAAVVSVYGLFANPGSIFSHLGTLAGIASGGGIDVIKDQLTRLTQHSGTALSFGFAASLVISLWFSNSGMTGLFDALNAVYEAKEQRSLIKYYAMTLTFTVGAIVLVLISIAITPQWRRIIWTSVLAAAVWLGVSSLFSWYVENFGSYNQIYGNLGAIVGFMTWMWLSMVVVLLGAKLDAELEPRALRPVCDGGRLDDYQAP